MKPINAFKTAGMLVPGDLWVRSLDPDHAVVIKVVEVQRRGLNGVHVTFDSNWEYANDDTFVEAFGRFDQVQVLLLADDEPKPSDKPAFRRQCPKCESEGGFTCAGLDENHVHPERLVPESYPLGSNYERAER